MQTNVTIPASEAAAYGEFRRIRRETEVALTLKRLVADLTARETDDASLFAGMQEAQSAGAGAVLVSPSSVAAAKNFTRESGLSLICAVGGTGESLLPVKKAETKRALRQGADEVAFLPSYRALTGDGRLLRRELRALRRAAGRHRVTVFLFERFLTEPQLRAAAEAAAGCGADAVCVCAESDAVLCALDAAGERMRVGCAFVSTAEQAETFVRAGVSRMASRQVSALAAELRAAAKTEE